jgi:hypothetical protein
MNPLKERRTATTTKTITTLFICSSLLVGFMALSISLSQTVSATAGPPEGRGPCPEGEFDRGECEVETITCPSTHPIVIKDPVTGEIIRCDKLITQAPDMVCGNVDKQVEVTHPTTGEKMCAGSLQANFRSFESKVPKCPDGFTPIRVGGVIVSCEKVESVLPDVKTETIRPGRGPERPVD